MKKLVLASAIVLCGSCVAAFAQSTEAPAGTRPAAREGERSTEQPPAPRPNDPNTTGDDKINGLEVPQMKDPKEGGRDR